MMKSLGLNWAAINVNVKKDPQFIAGSLSRPIRQIREDAVAMIKRAKDFAKAVGAPLVTCCPLSDGEPARFHNCRRYGRHAGNGFDDPASATGIPRHPPGIRKDSRRPSRRRLASDQDRTLERQRSVKSPRKATQSDRLRQHTQHLQRADDYSPQVMPSHLTLNSKSLWHSMHGILSFSIGS